MEKGTLTQQEIITIFTNLDTQAPDGYYSEESRNLLNKLATNNVKIKKLQEQNTEICTKLEVILRSRS